MKGLSDTLRNVEAAIKKLSINTEAQTVSDGNITSVAACAYPDDIHAPLLDPLTRKHKGRPREFSNLIDKIKKKKTKTNNKGVQKKTKALTRSKVPRKGNNQSIKQSTPTQESVLINPNHVRENSFLDLNNFPQDPFA
ncbi:hypothetical protein FRX31_009415 [Thalictrum thalictroides]|uniref:Uncharacterized protein n=1 Tax=Thalictrum thalictroides TaxID=46969 RepID=A0A7J6WWF3_THATH|nr:hypothetical protein FRX31_009415 [Thalictrum thalictroides]